MSLKCGWKDCEYNVPEILKVVDDGNERVILCPNHMVGYALDIQGDLSEEHYPLPITRLKSGIPFKPVCEITRDAGVVFRDIDGRAEFHLSKENLAKLVLRKLNPSDYKLLISNKNRNQDTFELHDDFYDSEGVQMQD
ncbi:hypothetical protein [Niallia taxi]|uniref:hypothetical protein n=1 Tax=Niallia taxi TaxID=2499688 RepID=UPI0015F634D8|nr:hypothetical protein [Niallia taxi]